MKEYPQGFPSLTPEDAEAYLNAKPEQEGKAYLSTWKYVMPKYFRSRKEFCNEIDKVRIAIKDKGVYMTEVNRMMMKVGKDEGHRKKIRALIGTLMHVHNHPKTEKITKETKAELNENLQEIHQEREAEDIQTMIQKMEKESKIDPELFDAYFSAQQEFLNNHEPGYTLTDEDKENIFLDVRKTFAHESTLSQEKLDDIRRRFTLQVFGYII